MAGELVYNFEDWVPAIVDEVGSAPARVAINMEQLRTRWEGQQTLDDENARTVLIERLMALPAMSQVAKDELANQAEQSFSFVNYVLANITPEYRTEAVIRGVNLEPLVDAYEEWAVSLGSGQGLAPEWEKTTVSGPMGITGTVVEGDKSSYGTASFWVHAVKPGVVEERKEIENTVNNTAGNTTDVALNPESTGALSPTAAYTDYAGSDIEEDFASYVSQLFEFGSGGNPTFSEEDLYKAFSLSRSQDLLDLNTIIETQTNAGFDVEQPVFNMPLPENTTGTRQRPVALNAAQALDYLRSSYVNQTQIANIQDKLIAAGYADAYTDNINIGDGFDDVTTAMWQQLLADAYLQKKSIRQVLAEKTQERSRNMPELDTPSNNLLVDQVAQTLIGRILSPDEKVSLWDAIRSDWATGSLAEGGQDPTMGFDTGDVENFFDTGYQEEIDTNTMAQGMDAVQNVLRRMT